VAPHTLIFQLARTLAASFETGVPLVDARVHWRSPLKAGGNPEAGQKRPDIHAGKDASLNVLPMHIDYPKMKNLPVQDVKDPI
jgi:hypothetical protein